MRRIEDDADGGRRHAGYGGGLSEGRCVGMRRDHARASHTVAFRADGARLIVVRTKISRIDCGSVGDQTRDIIEPGQSRTRGQAGLSGSAGR